MKLEVTGRHVAVTPALKTFAREKTAKLQKLIDDLDEVHVILTVEKHRHIAEIVARGRHITFSAREITPDMYTSIGEAIEKLERQARKHKTKHEARRRRPAAAAPLPAESSEEEPAAPRRAPSSIVRRRDAAAATDARPRIVRTDTFPRKPMSIEEAALQARDSELGFYVFRNSRSQEINVLFRRKDGTLGLIEPES